MSRAFTVEINHETVGLAVGEDGNFKFFSSTRRFDAIDGHEFTSLAKVNRAARLCHQTRARRQSKMG